MANNGFNPDMMRVLILGTGGMANTHANAYAEIPGVEIVAGVDKQQATLNSFCKRHDINHQFSSLQQALDWGEFDAVSNVTPDSVHCQTSLDVLAASKHILCEKPLATCYADAKKMADSAAATDVVNMVNLVYRDVPAVQTAARIVARGEIGQVRHFEASYLQSWLTQPAWGDWRRQARWLWRLSTAHGSHGVLGDVGIHILDFATYIAGGLPLSLSCQLKTFDKAENNQIGEYILDANDSFVLQTELDNGALGTISATRFASGHHNDLRLRLYGDKGGIEVLYEKSQSKLNICTGKDLLNANWREIKTERVQSSYQRFITAIRNQTPVDPDFNRGAVLQALLDGAQQSSNNSEKVTFGTSADT